MASEMLLRRLLGRNYLRFVLVNNRNKYALTIKFAVLLTSVSVYIVEHAFGFNGLSPSDSEVGITFEFAANFSVG